MGFESSPGFNEIIKIPNMTGQEIGKTDEGESIILSGGDADIEELDFLDMGVTVKKDFSNLDEVMEFDDKFQRRTFIKKIQLIRALVESHGVVKPACERCGVGRRTYYDYYHHDQDFRKAVDTTNEVAMDFVESKLFKNIASGYEASIIFFLKTRGRERGYEEHKQSTKTINLNVISTLTDDELEQRIAKFKGRVALADGETQKAIGG